MATRDVELIIKARDQATQIAKSVTEAFQKLTTAETAVGTAAGESTALISRLKSELQALQSTAQGLGQFQRVAGDIDRANISIGRFTAATERSNQALAVSQRSVNAAAGTYDNLSDQVRSSQAALQQQNATLDQNKADLAQLKTQVAQAGAAYRTMRAELLATKNPSDQLRQSVRDQRDTLVQLVEAQSRQEAAVAAQKNAVATAQNAFRQLSTEAGRAGNELRRANVAFEASAISARENAAALNQAETELEQLRTAAGTASTALGGVEASQEAIAASSQRTAQTIAQVTAAIEEQTRRAAAARAATANQVGDQGAASNLATQFRAQVAAVQQAENAWKSAQAEAQRLAIAMRQTAEPTAQLRAEFSLAKIAAADAKAAFQSQVSTLNTLRGQVRATAEARAQERASVVAAKAALDQYNRSLLGTIRNLIGLKNPAQQAAAALAQQAAAAQRAAQGLSTADRQRTQRVQNLAFQINDVLTQLASGTSLTRALGQQAGQFAQLSPTFNNLLVSLLRFVPILAVIGAALSPIIAAFINLGNQARSVREFNIALAGTENASQASAQGLAQTVRALDEYGLSVENARKVTTEFLNAGLNPDSFLALGEAVATVSKALGQEAPEAAQQLSRALTGNTQDVLELDNQVRALTAAERLRIIALGDAADAQEAQRNATERATIVAEAYERRAEAIAAQSRGPWSQAFRDLGAAFGDVVRAFENTGIIQELGRQFDELGAKVSRAAQNFRVGFAFLTGGRQGLVRLAEAQRAERDTAGDPRSQAVLAQQRREAEAAVAVSLAQQARSREREIGLARMGRIQAEGQRAVYAAQDAALERGVALTEEQTEGIRRQAEELARANQARRDGARESQSAVNRQRAFNLALQEEIGQRELQIRLLGMTRREAAILQATEQASLRAAQARVQITAEQLEQVRASAAALFDAQEAQNGRNTILQMQIQLREILNTNDDITVQQQLQEEAQLANIDLTTEYGRAWAEARRQVIEATRQVEALREAEELARARAANLRQGERDFEAAREAGETDAQLARRFEALQEQQRLLTEARDRAIELARALGDEAAVERLEALNTNIRDLGVVILSVADANRMLSEGLTNGIISATEQIALAIDGTQKWGDAISNIGDIFRQFAADFLRQIAQMIIQALILRAIQNSGLGGVIAGAVGAATKHGGGLVGSPGRRQIDPRVFIGAMKFHSGGLPGLTRGEVPAILQKGEEVLSRRDPRNVLNGGAKGEGVNVRNVNVFDSADVLQQALSRVGGERVILNYVRENAAAINDALAR